MLVLVAIMLVYLFISQLPASFSFMVSNQDKRPLDWSRKYVYFDLGLNNGDSLLNFFNLKSLNYVGGYLSFSNFSRKTQSSDWIVYAFEANPTFTPFLTNIKNTYFADQVVYLYTETAAWIYDGTIDFYLDTVNVAGNYWGSSLKKEHWDVVNSGQQKVTVQCKDVASLIKSYDVDDLVVVKIDIEGAEYDLLLNFIKKDVLKFIDYIAVEFHSPLSNMTKPEDVFKAIFNQFGTKYVNWT